MLQNDFTQANLNKAILILNRGKVVLSGNHWDGQLAMSFTVEVPQDDKRQRKESVIGPSQHQLAQIEAHRSSVTVIASTIEDPNKIISKNQQSNNHQNSMSDNCLILTGSRDGDMIAWRFTVDNSTSHGHPSLSKVKHFHDHDDQISSIFIHQEMQYFASSSFDGTCNLYSLLKLELLRCYQHPSLCPLTTVIVTQTPLAALAMFSNFDHTWQSFSINGQHLNSLEHDDGQASKNYIEESSHIVAPKVI